MPDKKGNETRKERSARNRAEHAAKRAADEAEATRPSPDRGAASGTPPHALTPAGENGTQGANPAPSGDPENTPGAGKSLIPLVQRGDSLGLQPVDLHVELGRYTPDKDTALKVAGLRCAGFSEDAVARYLDLLPETVRHHYAYQLDHGHEAILAEAALLTIEGALHPKGFIDRQFLLKTRGGWGSKGGPLSPGIAAPSDAMEPPVAAMLGGTKPLSTDSNGSGMPPPDADGRIPIEMSIGIEGDSMGADMEDDEDDAEESDGPGSAPAASDDGAGG